MWLGENDGMEGKIRDLEGKMKDLNSDDHISTLINRLDGHIE